MQRERGPERVAVGRDVTRERDLRRAHDRGRRAFERIIDRLLLLVLAAVHCP